MNVVKVERRAIIIHPTDEKVKFIRSNVEKSGGTCTSIDVCGKWKS